MAVTFRRAVDGDIGLIIGLAGASGSGKTYSAMRLAAGIAGNKPFAVIDTEAGRARHYARQFAFDHADLRPPYRPLAYADALKAADDAGYPVIVVDSFSHEHAGEGGILDWQEEELTRMAGTDWKRREACKMASWIKPKGDHKKMVSRLLKLQAHVILCFRAEQKIEIVTQNGETKVVPKKIASGFSDWIPICEKNILYELTSSFLLTPDAPGIPKPIKLQEQMRPFVNLNAPLDEQAGRKLAEWAKGGKEVSPSPAQALQDAAQELSGEPVDVTVEDTSVPPPFIWRVGKLPDQGGHKGKNIDDIPLDYLEWYAQKGTLVDHRNAAQAAVDWAKGQQTLGSEEVA